MISGDKKSGRLLSALTLLLAFGLGIAVTLGFSRPPKAQGPPSRPSSASAPPPQSSVKGRAAKAAEDVHSSPSGRAVKGEAGDRRNLSGPHPRAGSPARGDDRWWSGQEERAKVKAMKDRRKALADLYPLPLDRRSFVYRGHFTNGIFQTRRGFVPGRFGPETLVKYYESSVKKHLSEDRQADLFDRLWRLEEERARELQKLYGRENELIRKLEEEGKGLSDVVSWIVTRDRVYVIRKGDDRDLDDSAARLEEIEKRRASLVQQYIKEYGQ